MKEIGPREGARSPGAPWIRQWVSLRKAIINLLTFYQNYMLSSVKCASLSTEPQLQSLIAYRPFKQSLRCIATESLST